MIANGKWFVLLLMVGFVSSPLLLSAEKTKAELA